MCGGLFQAVQMVYFVICITEDVLRLSERNAAPREWVRRVKDFIFTSLFFPGTLVSDKPRHY